MTALALSFLLIGLTVGTFLLLAFGLSFVVGGFLGLEENLNDALASIVVGAIALGGAIVGGFVLVQVGQTLGQAAAPLPAPGDRRGWWGDAQPAVANDRIGSRLWLLNREKRLSSVLARARDYAREALAWLIADGIVASVDVEAEAIGADILAIGVTITRPDGPGRQRFDFVWERTADAI